MQPKLPSFRARLLAAFLGSYAVALLVQLGGAPQVQASASPEPAASPPVAAVPVPGASPEPAAVPPAAVPPAPELRPLPKIVAVDSRIARRADDLRPDVKRRLQRAAKALPEGVTLLITSAYRTTEEQQALTPTFGLKARPGTSTHEDGRGIDLNVLVDGERVPPREQQEYIGKAMAKAGFAYLGAADPVHYSVPAWKLAPVKGAEPLLSLPTLDEAQSPEGEDEGTLALAASAEAAGETERTE